MMEEERPVQDARQSIESGNAPPPDASATAGKSSTGLLVAGILVVVILIIAGLFLPPISLGQRLGLGADNASPSATQAPAETLSLPGLISLDVADPSGVSVMGYAAADFLAGSAGEAYQAAIANLPAALTPTGQVFTIDGSASASGSAALTPQADAAPLETLDAYGWNGSAWVFMPSRLDTANNQLVSLPGPLPSVMALMQVAAPSAPAVGAEADTDQTLVADVLPLVTDLSVGTLVLGDAGTLNGELGTFPAGGYRQWLHVTNYQAVIDQASLSSLLSDEAAQTAQINDLVSRVGSGGYAGIHLDYQGIPAEQKDAYTTFVANLATALQAQNANLILTLNAPTLLANGAWDTGGQDWVALGRLANVVYLQMPLDPGQYADAGPADQILADAVRQIDRNKLTLLASASAVDAVGEAFRELSGDAALVNFGALNFVQGGEEAAPGETIEVALSGSATPLEWDGNSVAYKYSYEENGAAHTVWLGNEAALNHRLRFAQKYHLRGVALRQAGDPEIGADSAAALRSYLGQGEAPAPQGAAIVWTVLNSEEGVLENVNGESLSFQWQAPETPGAYTIKADFAQGSSVASLGSLAVNVPEPVAEEPAVEETPIAAAPETQPEATGGDVTATVNTGSNVRSGPGLGYGVVAGLEPGTRVRLIGRNARTDWVQIELPDDPEKDGWIFAQLLTITGDPATLAVVEVAPPAVAAGGGGGGGAPAPAPAPVIAPAGGGSFELGGQTHSLAHPAQMNYSGMTWVKFQHKWGPGDSPSSVQGQIDSAHANGFKVLLSIPGSSTYPSSIDFNGYVEFLRGVAALGPDAIEIWNEMNIDFEWPAGQIDPGSYVRNMLAPAYNAIKSANSRVMVISGAPAPTGYFGGGCGTNGCDDNAYLAGMAAAGAASYMDCVGVHFNAGATSPTVSSGHPANSSHYSWYFQPTMDLYYNSFGGARPVCFTELGFLSGEDFGGVPTRFSWAGNTTVGQHAQWLAEAVSLAANSGKVRLAIIFNVDFTYYSDDPQAGYAMIRPNGSCPSCDLLANIMGSR